MVVEAAFADALGVSAGDSDHASDGRAVPGRRAWRSPPRRRRTRSWPASTDSAPGADPGLVWLTRADARSLAQTQDALATS